MLELAWHGPIDRKSPLPRLAGMDVVARIALL